MILMTLSVGILGVMTAYAFAESSRAGTVTSSIELSFVVEGRPAHVPVRFYDRAQSSLLFEALNPSAQGRRWYSLDPEGPILLPESLIQASVAVQTEDYWASRPQPALQVISAFSHFWSQPSDAAKSTDIVDLLAEAQVLPLSAQGKLNPGLDTFQRELAAAELRAKYTPLELLEGYLNTADYGNLAYGIDAAALVYFGKHAQSLDLAESAMLAPIPFDPALNPFDAPDEARTRQRALLVKMREAGLVSRTEVQRALTQELVFAGQEGADSSSLAGFLMDTFETRFGRRALGHSGLQVVTTIDADLQAQSSCILVVHLNRLNDELDNSGSQANSDCLASALLPPLRPGDAGQDHRVDEAGLVVLDATSGEVLSLAGEAQRQRPMGSMVQPFVYLTAFAEGYSPGSMVIDLPLAEEVPGVSNPAPLDIDRYHGPVRIRTALANSYPGAVERMVELVGVESVLRILETMGVRVNQQAGVEPGSWQGTLLDLAHASSVFAHDGVLAGEPASNGFDTVEPVVLREVLDVHGRLIYQADSVNKAVLSEQLAYLVNDVLSDEGARRELMGPSNPLEINRPAGALAGVTGDGRDAWALGYTPARVVAVWMGNPQGPVPVGLTPRNSSAAVWHAVIKYATRDLEADNWSLPPGVARVEVCDPSGLLPTVYCPETVREPFISGTEPTTFDNLFQPYLVNKETDKLATLSTPVELVEERIYLVPPPEAIDWAQAVGIEQPPREYDTLIQVDSRDPDLQLISPEPFAFLKGTVRVRGTVTLGDLDFYRLQVGKGLNPLNWIQLSEDRSKTVRGAVLAEWDTSGLEGLYTLQIIAVETDGQVRTAIVHVTVDNEPPVAELVFPQEGQTFSGGRTDEVAIQVDARDSFGVERVVFFIDGEEVAAVREEPFSIRWPMETTGSHTVHADIYDLAGNLAETQTIEFIVRRP